MVESSAPDPGQPDNPWWGRLLGWPLVVVVLCLLLGAPLAVKLSVWLSE